MSLLELLLVDLASLGFCNYLDYSTSCSILFVSRSIFSTIYPQILANVQKERINDVQFGGLTISTKLLFVCYPAATKSGNLQFIQAVLSHGGNPLAVNLQGDTPIHFAAASGNVDVVELLIQKGSKVTATNEHDMTPLHYAAMYKHPSVIASLVRAGAQVDALTFSKRTPLHYACMHTTAVAEATYDTSTHPSRPRRYVYSFFRGLTGMKNSDLLALLPIYPYSGAELQRQIDVAKLLISSHANPGARDERNLSPLHYASFFGPFDLVQHLLPAQLASTSPLESPSSPSSPSDSLSKIDQVDLLGLTPLMYACAAGHYDIVSLLLSLGARTSVLSRRLSSPLALAIQHGHVELVKLLLQKGESGKSWIEDYVILALKSRNREIAREVIKSQEDINARSSSLLIETVLRYEEDPATYYISLLLQKGADVHAREKCSGSTPLHLAIAKKYTEVVRMLIERGADVNANDQLNRSCLDVTLGPWCTTPNMEIVNLLLGRAITNIDQRDFMGNTILHRAVQAGNLQLVEALVERGAKVTSTNNKGETPCSLAKDDDLREYLEMVGTVQQT